MVKKRYGAEQIINRLRKVEVMLSNGLTIGEAGNEVASRISTRS